MKQGFILNLAYCRNCSFKMTDGMYSTPSDLKEEVVEMVKYTHELHNSSYPVNLRPCPKSELVISYTNCIYD